MSSPQPVKPSVLACPARFDLPCLQTLFARMYGEATSSNNVEWMRHKLMQGGKFGVGSGPCRAGGCCRAFSGVNAGLPGPSALARSARLCFGDRQRTRSPCRLRPTSAAGLGLPSKNQLSTRQRLAKKAEETALQPGRPDASASKKAVSSPAAMLRGQLLPGPQPQQQEEAAAPPPPPLTWRERQRRQQQQQPDCGGADALLAAAAAMEGAQHAEPPPRAPRGLALPRTPQEPRWEQAQQCWDVPGGYASSSVAPIIRPEPSRRYGSAAPYSYHTPGLAQAGGLAMASHAYLSPPPSYTPGHYYGGGGLNAYLLESVAPQALHPPAAAAPQPQFCLASWSLPLGGWEAGLGLLPAPGADLLLQGYLGQGGEHWLG